MAHNNLYYKAYNDSFTIKGVNLLAKILSISTQDPNDSKETCLKLFIGNRYRVINMRWFHKKDKLYL